MKSATGLGSLAAVVLSSGCSDTHTLGSFTKPQTLYLSCIGASHVGSINKRVQCCLFCQ